MRRLRAVSPVGAGALLGLLGCGMAYAAPRVEIDVLVAFDAPACQASRQRLDEAAMYAVNNLNQVMVRSRLEQDVHFNLVGTKVLTGYTSRALVRQQAIAQRIGNRRATEQELELLNEAAAQGFQEDYDNAVSGAIPGLGEERNRLGADMVLLANAYCPTGLLGKGWGYHMYLNEARLIAQGDLENAHRLLAERHFMAEFYTGCLVEQIGGMDVFSHECMHVLGCGHSDRQRSGPGPFYYADSSGYYSNNGQYSSLLCYQRAQERLGYPGVQQVQGDSIVLNSLSGPYSPLRPGSQASLSGVPDQMGDALHNNRATVLRNAVVVSCYRMRGNEVAPNAAAESAIPMPPLVGRKEFLAALPQEVPLEEAAAHMSATIPGLREPQALLSTVFGTNVPARTGGKPLPGGSGKVVWYSLQVPQEGMFRVGVRPFGTCPDMKPVVAVCDGKGRPLACTALTAQEAAAAGYMCACDVPAKAGTRLLVAVDSGNAAGGQFSLVARLAPGPVAAPVVRDAVPEPGQEPSLVGDILWLLLAFVSGGCLVWLLRGGHAARVPAPVEVAAEYGRSVPVAVPAAEPAAPAGHVDLYLVCTLGDGSRVKFAVPLKSLAARGSYYIGRHASCELQIRDASVSGVHAVLKVRHADHGGRVVLLGDAGSTNGTWLNGRRLAGDACATLRDGSTITLGKVNINVSVR